MLHPRCSVRQYKCLFVSVLVVCAIMAIANINLQPKAQANDNGRKALAVAWEKNEIPAEIESSANVKFLPVTETSPSVPVSEKLTDPRKEEIVQRIADGPPIFYPGQVSEVRLGRPAAAKMYLSQDQNDEPGETKPAAPFVPVRRLIHFDLKGAPPKVAYLQKVIEMAAKLGANGLLLEYEDMFPYDGVLEPIATSNHYTKSEVLSLLATAKSQNLEVIPLVQTFGHLEYVLKMEKFADIRENPDVPQAICPSRNESLRLVETLIDQIMALHKDVKYLHIGCDEVFHIAECSLCSLKSPNALFLEHVQQVAKYVRNKYQVTPIIWDDMMRHISTYELIEAQFGILVEPMVWVYAEDVYHFAGEDVFQRYSKVFPSFWVSSAFKGAFGETLVLPDVKRHFDNNMKWLQVGENEAPKFSDGLHGIVITGWQRYDHFATLCELLPAGIPSMALNLLSVSSGYFNDSLAPLLYRTLSCMGSKSYERVPDLENDRFLTDSMGLCFFPGAPFFKLASRFIRTEKEITEFVKITTKRRGWLTDFNVRHNYTSPARVDELVRDLAYHAGSLHTLARQTKETLRTIFDVHTISEWLEQKLLPLFQQLDRIQTDAVNLKKRKYWPHRPLPTFDQWNYYGIQLDDLKVSDSSSTRDASQPAPAPARVLSRN